MKQGPCRVLIKQCSEEKGRSPKRSLENRERRHSGSPLRRREEPRPSLRYVVKKNVPISTVRASSCSPGRDGQDARIVLSQSHRTVVATHHANAAAMHTINRAVAHLTARNCDPYRGSGYSSPPVIQGLVPLVPIQSVRDEIKRKIWYITVNSKDSYF
ncbi:Hypothetical predicted protein [Mytilus galloprovincialis]|uniref:Uncharacterized protein n=1 Tax=Mytilus galloprovincialis TaxID=29158 RepID=A0A8B6EYK6_MYTGA|nr:Hypothetical predicted protein [Mytilus galloprovincialis]